MKKQRTVEKLNSEEQHLADEQQAAKAMAEVTRNVEQTALVKVEDARVETVRANTKSGSREIARARTGKFVSRTEQSAMVAAKKTQTFLVETDPETGASRHDTLLTKIYEGAKKASNSDKGLGPAVKAVELLDEISGHRALRENAFKEKLEVQPVRVVLIAPITNMMDNSVHDYEEEKKKAQERASRGPSFAEVIDIQQNPPIGNDRC